MLSNNIKQLLEKKNNKGQNEDKGNKRKIENLAFFIVLVIITIVVINLILKDDKDKNTNEQNISNKTKQLASTLGLNKEEVVQTNSTNADLGKELEEILKKIQGVQDVKVFINYSESSETLAMYNENSKTTQTEEADTSGGTRKIEENDTQKEVIYQENNGEKVPITQKVVNPKIEGAIITAKGTNNVNVKTSIIQAVEAATGLPTHKIQVFEMN